MLPLIIYSTFGGKNQTILSCLSFWEDRAGLLHMGTILAAELFQH